jgi:predicted component of type VI protein secretion system
MSLIETRTLDRCPRDDDGVRAPHLFLVIQAARPTASASRHALVDVDEVAIGRGDAQTWRRTVERGVRRLAIEVPDEWMSTRHVEIRVRIASVHIADVGSKNGTFVNGQAITTSVLADGDVIEVGRTAFYFAASLPAPSGAPPDLDAEDLRGPAGLQTLLPDLARRFSEVVAVAASAAPILVLTRIAWKRIQGIDLRS